jgi:hypothetical protein
MKTTKTCGDRLTDLITTGLSRFELMNLKKFSKDFEKMTRLIRVRIINRNHPLTINRNLNASTPPKIRSGKESNEVVFWNRKDGPKP